jgi:alkaline phosphatase
LPELTASYFAKHDEVFKGMKYTIKTNQPDRHPILTVENKGNVLKLVDDSSVAELNGKTIQLNTVVVYMDRNKTFYLPKELAELLQ